MKNKVRNAYSKYCLCPYTGTKLKILLAVEMSLNPLICRYAFRTEQRRKGVKFMNKNRSRRHKFTLYLSDDEHRILCAKFKISGMRSKSSFLRQLIIAGFVYDVDYSYLREYNYLLGKIGANLNQIAKRVNETRSICQADMDEIKGEMEKLLKVQKAMLKKQPVMSQ